MSVSYCSKYCISIKIEQFAAKLKRRNRAILKVINHTIELVFFIYMIPFAFSFLMSSVYNGQVSPACQIPMYYVQAAPFVSFVLVAIRILHRWIIEFKIALGKPVYDPAHPERNTQEAIIKANTDEETELMLDPADDKVLQKDLKDVDLSGDDYRDEDSMHNDEASSHIKKESDNEADRKGDSV